MDFTNPLVYGVPVFIAFILLELTYSKTHDHEHHHELYNWKDLAASGFMGIGSAILGPLFKVAFAILLFEGTYELFNPVVDGVRTNIIGTLTMVFLKLCNYALYICGRIFGFKLSCSLRWKRAIC